MTVYSLPPFLTLCSFLWLGAITAKHRRWSRSDILFFIICLFGSFLYIDILLVFNVRSEDTALLISRLDHLFVVYLSPVYIHFFHTYLGIKKGKRLLMAAYIYAFILMMFTQSDWYIESMKSYRFGYFAAGGPLYPFFGLLSLGASVYVLLLLFRAIRHERSSIGKYRLRYVFVGFGSMGLLNALNILPVSGYAVYPPGNWSFIPLVVFGIGLFRHDLLDTGTLIHKGLIYTVLTAFLTTLYAAVVLGAERMISGFNRSDSYYLSFGFILLAAFTMAPLRERVQIGVDRIFFREKYDYRKTLKSVGRRITSVLDSRQIARRIMDVVSKTMQVENCRLFILDEAKEAFVLQSSPSAENPGIGIMKHDCPLIWELRKKRAKMVKRNYAPNAGRFQVGDVIEAMTRLQAEIIIPFHYKEKLTGFLAMGEKRSGDLFTPEEFDLLEILADQSALAFENARSYALLNRMNENLEKTVSARTRELRQALHEKEISQERLIKSESLAAIGELVAGAAHELNNPLASVMSLLQSSVEEMKQWDGSSPFDEDVIEDLEFAGGELQKAKHIVESLLGLSRQTVTFAEDVNLNTVVKNALRVLHNQYKQGKVVILENYDTDLPVIRGNFANLGQVAVNIIKNAIQAVKPVGGEIMIMTRFEKGPDQVVFECRDTGPGIQKEHRLDIFKPFFTTKPVGEGTGLGLYICHEIVERHGGALSLEDNNGKGAHFVVTFPT
ncbi:MAG: ATP-binding protein [Desulfobacterales bacterium]